MTQNGLLMAKIGQNWAKNGHFWTIFGSKTFLRCCFSDFDVVSRKRARARDFPDFTVNEQALGINPHISP